MISREVVRRELRLKGLSILTTDLDRYIRQASELLASHPYLGYPPWREKIQEDFSGAGGLVWRPTRHPLETIASLTRDGSEVSGAKIIGQFRDQIYLENGWEDDRAFSAGFTDQAFGERAMFYQAVYYSGWIMPGQATTWTASTAYAAGDIVMRTDWEYSDLYLECSAAGTSGLTQPTLPAQDAVVADSSVVWTGRACELLPESLQQDVLKLVLYYHADGIAI